MTSIGVQDFMRRFAGFSGRVDAALACVEAEARAQRRYQRMRLIKVLRQYARLKWLEGSVDLRPGRLARGWLWGTEPQRARRVSGRLAVFTGEGSRWGMGTSGRKGHPGPCATSYNHGARYLDPDDEGVLIVPLNRP